MNCSVRQAGDHVVDVFERIDALPKRSPPTPQHQGQLSCKSSIGRPQPKRIDGPIYCDGDVEIWASPQLLRDVVRDRLRHSRILKDEALDRWTEKARRLGCNGESFGYDYLLCAPLDAFDDCSQHCLARHEFEKAAEVVPHTARHGIVKDLVDHQRSKETWVRTSYCDADLTQFGPQRIAQRPHTGFAGAVRSVQRGVDEASHGRDSEKVASLVGDVRHGGFEPAPDAVEVNLDRAFPFFWRHARDRSDGATDSSACNDDIQTFEMRRDLGHHLIEVVEVAYVDLPAPGHALAAELVRQFADRVGVEVKERDARPLGTQGFGQICAEAAGGAGDCDGAVCEVVFHRMPSGRGVGALLRRLRLTRNAAGPVAGIAVSPPLARSPVEAPCLHATTARAVRRTGGSWAHFASRCAAIRRLETTGAFASNTYRISVAVIPWRSDNRLEVLGAGRWLARPGAPGA